MALIFRIFTLVIKNWHIILGAITWVYSAGVHYSRAAVALIVNIIGQSGADFLFDNRYAISAVIALWFAFSAVFANHKRKTMWKEISVSYNMLHEDYAKILPEIVKGGVHEDKFALFGAQFITQVARICTHYVGAQCHVCLKTYDQKTGMVQTYLRCSFSRETRSSIDAGELQEYLYRDNEAFRHIIEGTRKGYSFSLGQRDDDNHLKWQIPMLDGRGYYLGRCLHILDFLRLYRNSNPVWRSHYKSTLVVPVSPKFPMGDFGKDDVYGFLCIDCKKWFMGDSVLVNMARQLGVMWGSIWLRTDLH